MTSGPGDAPDPGAFPPALHAKVAAAKAAWEIAVCARHAVVPEHHWPHELDRAELRAARALTELASGYLERAVVSARAEGLTWPAIGETLGVPDAEAVFAGAVDGWAAELAAERTAPESGRKWVVDTAWWADALREWLTSPGRNFLDSAADKATPAGKRLWRTDTADDGLDAGFLP
ncbi:hypothetical protein [Amycolatopsis sp. WQ 127309]|uniref:hypothetical protein n=1 Tax=Amycolatopsis sp. WQ 127309 TaxID=2932773 RepID=UPI001FF1356E|nr:hypothetical protein [Amycolatopsis sp. WQ 127309]UOZ02756.1 hypothetical protein MUY22_28240 [Amycolatopsis sp. WQ 127309]